MQAGPLSAASGQGWLPHRVGDREGASHKRMACQLDGVRWSLRGKSYLPDAGGTVIMEAVLSG